MIELKYVLCVNSANEWCVVQFDLISCLIFCRSQQTQTQFSVFLPNFEIGYFCCSLLSRVIL
jgi:hypothetical protein